MESSYEDLGAELADSVSPGKSKGPRVRYATVERVGASTLDVSLAGGMLTGVCMTASCSGAAVGDRVVLLVDGPLVTALGIIATPDNARYVKQGGDSASASLGVFDMLRYRNRSSIATMSANGKGGYFRLARITVKDSYANSLPVILTVANRSCGMGTVSVQFSNSSTKDPGVNVFRTGGVGADLNCYIAKAATSTWDVYMKANENWGAAYLYDLGPYYESIDVAPVMERVDSLPSGYIAAARNALTAYPVGSIYMSASSTNPGNIFGGTWSQITGRFLLACGGGYSAGTTGGEATHKLAVSEMPSHTHSVRCAYTTGSSRRDTDVLVYDGWNMEGYMWTSQWSGSTGGSAAHNNMPPYLAVYVWKRTA